MYRLPSFHNKLIVFSALACLVGASSAQAQSVVYSQATNMAGSNTSQNDPGSYHNYATAYDNFTLPSATGITTVTWDGSYFTGGPGGVTDFTIQFYADNAGVPGSILATEPILGNANETYLGIDTLGDPVYTYSTELSTLFNASAGTQYWMSIVGTLNYPPQWGWEQATGGDGASYESYFSSAFSSASDLTFSLGTGGALTTPEPSSLALFLGLALVGSLVVRKPKRTGKAT